MFELISPFTILLLVNSLVLIVLILNQNENVKDSLNNQASSSSTNPLEKFTWICFSLQFLLFFWKVKSSDF